MQQVWSLISSTSSIKRNWLLFYYVENSFSNKMTPWLLILDKVSGSSRYLIEEMSFSKFSTFFIPSYFGTQQNYHLTASRSADRALALKTKTMWTNRAIHYATVDSPGRREAKNYCCSKDRYRVEKVANLENDIASLKPSPSIQMPHQN